jgi:protein-arginine kinase
MREAITELSALRLGSALGLVSVPMEKITSLRRDAEGAYPAGARQRRGERGYETIDYTRAKLIREAIA